MNERDVPQFDARSVEFIIERFMNSRPYKLIIAGVVLPSDVYWSEPETRELAKQIIEYATLCCVIPPRSTMK